MQRGSKPIFPKPRYLILFFRKSSLNLLALFTIFRSVMDTPLWGNYNKVTAIALQSPWARVLSYQKKDMISHRPINCIAFRRSIAVNGIIKNYIMHFRPFPPRLIWLPLSSLCTPLKQDQYSFTALLDLQSNLEQLFKAIWTPPLQNINKLNFPFRVSLLSIIWWMLNLWHISISLKSVTREYLIC